MLDSNVLRDDILHHNYVVVNAYMLQYFLNDNTVIDDTSSIQIHDVDSI